MSAFTYSAMGLSPQRIGPVRCLPIVLDKTPSVLTAGGVYFCAPRRGVRYSESRGSPLGGNNAKCKTENEKRKRWSRPRQAFHFAGKPLLPLLGRATREPCERGCFSKMSAAGADNRILPRRHPCRKSFTSIILAKVGLEPTLTCVNRILSPARLPFRHLAAILHRAVRSCSILTNGSAAGRALRHKIQENHFPFGVTRILRYATGPWSPWSMSGPTATSAPRAPPVAPLVTSTFS